MFTELKDSFFAIVLRLLPGSGIDKVMVMFFELYGLFFKLINGLFFMLNFFVDFTLDVSIFTEFLVKNYVFIVIKHSLGGGGFFRRLTSRIDKNAELIVNLKSFI